MHEKLLVTLCTFIFIFIKWYSILIVRNIISYLHHIKRYSKVHIHYSYVFKLCRHCIDLGYLFLLNLSFLLRELLVKLTMALSVGQKRIYLFISLNIYCVKYFKKFKNLSSSEQLNHKELCWIEIIRIIICLVFNNVLIDNLSIDYRKPFG